MIRILRMLSLASQHTVFGFHDYYELGKLIGQGGFGLVFEAKRRADNFTVVVKIIPHQKCSLDFDPILGYVPREVKILKTIRHHNIIRFIEYFNGSTQHYIVMERFGDQKGDLFEHIETFIELNEMFSEERCRYIFKQVVDAVVHLAERHSIFHCDIKDENILIDEHDNIKLIDFGSSHRITDTTVPLQQFFGTIQYAPPEIIIGQRYQIEPAEIWKLGCLLFVLLYNRYPFKCPKATVYRNLELPTTRSISDNCRNLLFSLLVKKPAQRLTLRDLKQHPWLQ